MKEPVSMHRLSEDSIARVLYYVRAEIIRDGMDGQEHVDALLTLLATIQSGFMCQPSYPAHSKGAASFKERS